VDRHGGDVQVVKMACPGFVELVETGEISGPHAYQVVREALAPALEAHVDRVVLGCTHYPFLRPLISEIMGAEVEVLDSGAAVARQVERVLGERGILRQKVGEGTLSLYTTGDPSSVQPVVEGIWGQDADVRAA
jgi:glutamate racemase